MGVKHIEHAHKLCCMFGAPFVDDDHAYKLALFTTEMTTDATFYGPRRQHKDLIKLLDTTCGYVINVNYKLSKISLYEIRFFSQDYSHDY